MNVFSYSDPIKFLQDFIEQNQALGKIKTRLAEAAGCKSSYFSNVLKGTVNLTVEQAFGLTLFMNLSESEIEYFLLLVQHSRAGSRELRDHFKHGLNKIKEKEFKLKNTFKNKESLTPDQVRLYYSSWIYQVIHMLITIPQYQSIKNISHKLTLSEENILAKLNALKNMGLAKQKNGCWYAIKRDIHIPADDPSSIGHQLQWKTIAIQDMIDKNTQGIHYNAVYSLSNEDFHKVKMMIMNFIKEKRTLVEASPEEELAHFQISFFQV